LGLISISYYFFRKSKKGNEKWTFLKMSKNENPKRVLKRGSFSGVSYHNALKNNSYMEKHVMLIFRAKMMA
jgi:hypothetical protein